MQRGLIFNIQKYSVHDGPGIRTTVFLKGCPLRCAWCHNPEGWSDRPALLLMESRCLRCGACRAACPSAEARAGTGPLPASAEYCTLCGACVEACPTEARQMVGREMTVAAVLAAVLADRVFYEESRGGVTFSGGEPLRQPDFLLAALAACQAQGIHTAVDTCGFSPPEALLAIGRFTDLFLYDLKFVDDELHRQYTGASNEPILENLQALGQVHRHIWLRVPLIPGINDGTENLEAVARLASSIPGVRQVNLLPYHRAGLQKFRRLAQACPLDGLEPPAPERLERALQIFRAQGLVAQTGG